MVFKTHDELKAWEDQVRTRLGVQLIRLVLDLLGLEMGLVDLQLTPEGEVVRLDVNPQGQFLFLEGRTGGPLTEHFAEFLIGA